MSLASTVNHWLALPDKQFSRSCQITESTIVCDCSGFVNRLFAALKLKTPYGLTRPKAVHYFGILQEIGSNRIDTLKPGSLLAWRKMVLPKSGDTGHVLVVMDEPQKLSDQCYSITVVDATKKYGGLTRREIKLYTNESGILIGVRFSLDDKKVKHTAIYHHQIEGSRYCFGCGVPSKVCNCQVIQPLLSVPPVVILRHTQERKRTLSTVSLIKQRYPNVFVIEGEVFAPIRLANPVLLFPGGEDLEVGQKSAVSASSVQSTYLLIDATWRKAKRIVHVNTWLQALPRVSIDSSHVSQYLLRKVASKEQLSSVEAFAEVVQDQELGAMLPAYMQKQIELMGEQTYKSNYRNHINFDDKTR